MSCPDCTKGSVLPGKLKGSINAEFQGAYFSPAPENSSKKNKRYTILLLTDAFGLPLKNCKIMADEMAKRLECDVWIPDYFNEKPILPLNAMILPERAGVKLTIYDWFRFLVVTLTNLPAIISNRHSVVDKRLEIFIALLKEKREYDRIGAVGYCFGGATCIRLGSTGLVDTVVITHPGRFTLDQVKAMKIPAAWVCAQEDFMFPDSLRNQAEAEFAGRKGKNNFVEYEFKEWKGTQHGFASRPNLNLPEIKAAYEGAFEQTIEWFKKTLVN